MKDGMSESWFDSSKKASSSLKPLKYCLKWLYILKHFEMLSQSTVDIPWNSRKFFLDKTEFITSMDFYPYSKEHLYTSNLWNIILKQLSIKALTSDISWHNLDKNYIDLWLLLMYIPTQKSKSQVNGPPLYKHKMFGTWSWNK